MIDKNNLNIQKLSPEEKRKLVEQLLAKKAEKTKEDKYSPLSYLQQGLWSLSQFAPQSWVSNVLFSAKILSRIDFNAFQKSCELLIERHPSLRTNYTTQNEIPVQKINSQTTFKLEHIDVSDWNAKKLAEKTTAIIRQPFDLEKDSVIRVSLLSQSPTEHILLLVVHHIAVDLWSLMIIVDELRLIYANQLNDSSLPLPPIKSNYIDYVDWQAQMLKTARGKKLKEYWHHKLSGELPVLDLRTDKPRPPVQTFAGASHTFRIGTDLTQKLRKLAQTQSASLYMVLLSAFNILLCRYSGQEEVVVGTLTAGRNGREFASVVGAFLNLVALRGDITGNPNFLEFLTQTRSNVLEALQHQEYPFQLLTQELEIAPDSSRSPIFQVMFLLQKLQRGEDFADFIVPTPSEATIDFGGLVMQPYPIPHQEGNFDLMLEVIEANKSLQCILKYNPDLFELETIATMTEHFETLLTNIVNAPEQPISCLSILTSSDRNAPRFQRDRQLLAASKNLIKPDNPFTEFPKSAIEQSIPSRFSEQVKKYPQQIAIQMESYRWTYEELDRESNRIAHHLLNIVSDTEDRIALLFDPGALAIAAILAVLKIGKTYVALDPSYPSERLSYILEDSLASLVVTQQANLTKAQDLARENRPIIDVDRIPTTEETPKIELQISPDTLAYLIYTSGSTGKPKGVMQNHRNVLHFIRNYTNNLHLNSEDRLTLLSSYSFDASIMAIFGALLNGATLCPYDLKKAGLNKLAEWLNQNEITIYHSTPTVFRYFLAASEIGDRFPAIRLVVLGGEEVVKSDITLYKQHFSPECLLINGLGPSESTVTLQYFINRQTVNPHNKVPVGYAVEDTEIILLDSNSQPTDLVGEIAIASPHVALGYWQQPELTAKAFFPDPNNQNNRIYRTGDWGRLRRDGSLEFLGRRDFQVKIRGFRLELGEIEAVLSQYPQVKEAVVTATKNEGTELRLAAYVVPCDLAESEARCDREKGLNLTQLNDFLQEKLPEYAIPGFFSVLDALPLTPSGKVNRLALPQPDWSQRIAENTFIPPQTPLEKQLAKIWCDVLQLDSVGIRDSFFNLGGHSLLALQLFAKIKHNFGRELPVTALFQAPTIEKLAPMLEEKPEITSSWSNLVEIQSGNSQPPWFFVHAAGGGGMIQFQELANYIDSDKPFYGLDSLGLHGEQTCPSTIEETATLYLKEIRKVQPEGPYFIGGLCFGGLVAYEMAQQLQAVGEEIGLLVAFNTLIYGAMTRIPTFQRFSAHALKAIQEGPSYGVKKLQGKIQWLKNRQQEQSRVKNIDIAMQYSQPQEQSLTYNDRRLLLRKTHIQAIKDYVPKPYSGKVTLFQTEGDLIPPEGYYKDPQWGWGELAKGGLEIHVVPGRHNNVLIEPHIKIHGKKLRACLDRAYQNFGIS